jgi:hypothetical protein
MRNINRIRKFINETAGLPKPSGNTEPRQDKGSLSPRDLAAALKRAGCYAGLRWAEKTYPAVRCLQWEATSKRIETMRDMHDITMGPDEDHYSFVSDYGVINCAEWISGFVQGALEWLERLDGENDVMIGQKRSNFRKLSKAVFEGKNADFALLMKHDGVLVATWRNAIGDWLPPREIKGLTSAQEMEVARWNKRSRTWRERGIWFPPGD